MPVRQLAVAMLGVLVVLTTSRSGLAAAEETLGADCAAQDANDAQVRALFAPLLRRFASTVGRPVGCLADASDGGLTQRTTSGLLYARPEGGGPVRIVVFTDGYRHWAVDANLGRVTLTWDGDAPYPPTTGVTRIPLTPAEVQAESPWPPSPAPTVGRSALVTDPAHRPATGENVVPPTYAGGHGMLALGNELPIDVAFKVRDADGARATRAFVYVRAGERAQLEGVAAGTYEIQGISGVDWDPEAKIFRRALKVFKADEPFELTETRTEDGVFYVTGTFSIRQVEGQSDVGISPLDLESFQKE